MVSAGTLSGDTTSLQGNITNDATVIFDQASDGIFSGVLSGSGSLLKTNAGKLTFTAANSQGGTTMGQGILQIGNGGTTGSLAGNITNNAVLTFNRSDNITQSSVISGSGAVNKLGAGTATFTGANTFSGALSVQAGVLNLNGAGGAAGSAASVSVATNATLLISQSGQVNDTATASLSGGTIRTAGGVTEAFGNLNVSTASFLDFGATSYATKSSMSFGNYTPSALLTLQNFDYGSTLIFKSNLSSAITNSSLFAFQNGGIGSYSWNAGTGTFTITAIPEPSTYFAATGLIGLILWPSRKRIIRYAKRTLGLRPPMRDRLAARRA